MDEWIDVTMDDGCVNGYKVGLMGGGLYEFMDNGVMDGWVEIRKNEWRDGWMDGWMDGCNNGWMC